MARLTGRRSPDSENLDPRSCIQVDEMGRAMFMVMTDDGRWVPAEEW